MEQPSLTIAGRLLILLAAFAAWLCAGTHLAVTSLAMQSAAIDLLARTGQIDRARYAAGVRGEPDADFIATRERIARWFTWYQCAFLFGAATGGLVFGRIGDRLGRVRGLGLSILTYSLFAAAASHAQEPWQLLVLWFVACTGVGGTWPNGVALASEVWTDLSRPTVAGLLGMSANIGIFLMATLAAKYPITPDAWRWVMIPAAAPVLLGVFVLLVVPESPLFSGLQIETITDGGANPRGADNLQLLVLGIALATVPMLGAWGSANWMVPWAAEAGEAASPPNPFLKANVQQARALTGIAGSFLGGWIAALVGRRLSYCLVSLGALFCAQYTFWLMTPTTPGFLVWVSALGFFSGVYFGWMPLFLPELFPTATRSTGAGVSFNFGRIVTAGTIALTGVLMTLFAGDYARIGRVTSLIFVVGVGLVWLAPDTSRRGLGDGMK